MRNCTKLTERANSRGLHDSVPQWTLILSSCVRALLECVRGALILTCGHDREHPKCSAGDTKHSGQVETDENADGDHGGWNNCGFVPESKAEYYIRGSSSAARIGDILQEMHHNNVFAVGYMTTLTELLIRRNPKGLMVMSSALMRGETEAYFV